MKLERYLKEYISGKADIMSREDDPGLDNILNLLEKDCKKFINTTGGFLFRSTDKKIGGDGTIEKRKVRTNRRPVDTDKKIHAMADISSKKKFGWSNRSEGLFTTTREGQTVGYGSNLHLIFPIGNFKFIWSDELYDFFIAQSDFESEKQQEFGWRYKITQDDMDELYQQYTDKNLSAAFKDRQAREVILYCPNGYYAVSPMAIGELSYYLKIDRV